MGIRKLKQKAEGSAILHTEPRAYKRQGPRYTRHSHPCQDPDSHPARSGIVQRPVLLNELVRSTSFTLTIYTIPYPQGHTGLHESGNPSAATPFLSDKRDTMAVYRLMYQTFSDNLQQRHRSEAPTESRSTLAALETARKGDEAIPSPRPRTVWASGQGSVDAALKRQRVILKQNGKDNNSSRPQSAQDQGPSEQWASRSTKDTS